MSTTSSVAATPVAAPSETAGVDWEAVRAQFPALHQEVHGKPLVYLDNAASSQMPQPVIDRFVRYLSQEHSNVHRGVHTLSQRATDAFEDARARIASFIGSPTPEQCVFVRGATEGINLVASGWGRQHLRAGDEVVLTVMEHHSNIVPWQMLRDELGIVLRVVPVDVRGVLDLEAFHELLSPRTKLVGCVHVSNALGTVNPVAEIVAAAHEVGARVLVDGCQAMPHQPVDVVALGADFYVFSAHKMNGPTGVGAVYATMERWEETAPYQGGGDMIASVSFEETTYNELPHRFEAGTPAIAQAVAWGETARFLSDLGMERVAAREAELLAYANARLAEVPGFVHIGQAPGKASVISFMIEGIHPHDIGTLLDNQGIAIRVGHHCTEPLMRHFAIPGTARASLSYYNNASDIDALVEALATVVDIFGLDGA